MRTPNAICVVCEKPLYRRRAKGTNHRTGYSHRVESKIKTSAANRAYWSENPNLAVARAPRAETHYRWKGGASRLNVSIRQMNENRKWMDAVKARDRACLRCGSSDLLEAHHRETLAALIEILGIRSRDDARQHAAILWDLANGETLCRSCHYAEHERKRHAD